MKVNVYVTLKQGVLDPQGKAVGHALDTLGFKNVANVRIGKLIELEIAAKNKTQAKEEVKEMCEKLLANTVIESYQFEIE